MAHTQSRSAVSVMLERYEMEALIAWHRDEQYRLCDDEKYQEAANHQDRVLQLVQTLDDATKVFALTSAQQQSGDQRS